jgi:hypothetical protein
MILEYDVTMLRTMNMCSDLFYYSFDFAKPVCGQWRFVMENIYNLFSLCLSSDATHSLLNFDFAKRVCRQWHFVMKKYIQLIKLMIEFACDSKFTDMTEI